jgi:hypothetical protein
MLHGNSPYIDVIEALYSFFPEEDPHGQPDNDIEDPTKPPSEYVRLIVPLKVPINNDNTLNNSHLQQPHPQTLNKRSRKRRDYCSKSGKSYF